MSKKRASGGKRAVERKHAAQAAARTRQTLEDDDDAEGQPAPGGGDDGGEGDTPYDRKWRARYRSLVGDPPIASAREMHDWAMRLAAVTAWEESEDFAVPPEQRRERNRRSVKAIAETLDGAKLSQELRELYAAMKASEEAAQEGVDATPVEGGDGRVPPSETDLL
jgi:hypothetical protein